MGQYTTDSPLAAILRAELERHEKGLTSSASIAGGLAEAFFLGQQSKGKAALDLLDLSQLTKGWSEKLEGRPGMWTQQTGRGIRYASDEDVICGYLTRWHNTPKEMRADWLSAAEQLTRLAHGWLKIDVYSLARDWCGNVQCCRSHCRKVENQKRTDELDPLLVLRFINKYNKKTVT